ncbi:MAG: hypothetical protein WC740_11880 [Verrucomicrobiia bacterium]
MPLKTRSHRQSAFSIRSETNNGEQRMMHEKLRAMNFRNPQFFALDYSRFTSLSRILLLLALAGAAVARSETPIAPDDRDRQVLETALLRILTDSELIMTRVSENKTTVVLNVRTPDKSGFIQPDQMWHYLGEGHSIPGEIGSDLLRRNGKPGTYDSQYASFAGLKFDQRVIVTTVVKDKWANRLAGTFERAHPKARAWVEAWLPGYSKDGTKAVVRAHIGPGYHAALLTVFLEKRGDKWLVKWHHLSQFV